MALDAGRDRRLRQQNLSESIHHRQAGQDGQPDHAGATSVGSVAVELAEQIFGDLGGTRVLILGAGDMSRVTGPRPAWPAARRAFT